MFVKRSNSPAPIMNLKERGRLLLTREGYDGLKKHGEFRH
jgi:hypothetical protein